MAGDWIKMRAGLHTHPKVVRIASALDADRLRIVGALHATWCLFDAHSIDGVLDGYTKKTLDDMIGFPGFAAAMISVGWLCEEEVTLCMPRFNEHNGQSAKRRAQDADRKRSVRKASASDADKKRTREEKRREEIKEQEREDRAPEEIQDEESPQEAFEPPLGKFAITASWKPAPEFEHRAALWGIFLGEAPGYTPEELQQFRDYWSVEGRVKHHQQWEQTFAQSLRSQREQAQRNAGRQKTATLAVPQPGNTIPDGFTG